MGAGVGFLLGVLLGIFIGLLAWSYKLPNPIVWGVGGGFVVFSIVFIVFEAIESSIESSSMDKR